jgi:hypothetical protein
MTSEGLGEVFKGDSADTRPEKFRSCRWGDEQTVKRAQMVSEDPHRRERNFLTMELKQIHSHGKKLFKKSFHPSISFFIFGQYP